MAAAFAEKHFSTYSLPWAFIVLFAYILKDRVKEVLRSIIGALASRLLSDWSHRLLDGAGRSTGLTREAVSFPRHGQVPAEVLGVLRGAPAPRRRPPGSLATASRRRA